MLGQNVAAVNIVYIISVLFRGAVTPRAYDAMGAQLPTMPGCTRRDMLQVWHKLPNGLA